MMITREYLDQRLAEISAARDSAQADVVANNGALQLLKHMLAGMDAEKGAAFDEACGEAARRLDEAEQVVKKDEDEGEPRPDLKANGEAAGP